MSINGISYGEVIPGGINYEEDISKFPKVTNVCFHDKALFNILKDPTSPDYPQVHKTMLILSLCHTIITEVVDDQIAYNASSPDELALINMSRFCGYLYMGKDERNVMTVQLSGKKYEY